MAKPKALESVSDRLAKIQEALHNFDLTGATPEARVEMLRIRSALSAVTYDTMVAEERDPAKLSEYCRVHAKRMMDEGFTKTALVLEWAADRIETRDTPPERS